MKYSYAIIADITCDLSNELRDRFEVDGILKGYMSTPDAEDVEGRLDLSDAEIDAFYKSLKENPRGYKTAAPGIEPIASYFETFFQDGRDVLALSISSTLSVTYNIMTLAAKQLLEKYPERKITVVDSGKYSLALGLLVIKAAELRAAGLSLTENAEKLETIRKTVHQMGSVDDLFWVASKGRISHAKAFFGTIAGIKAMGDFDANGMVTPLAKVSGYKKSHQITVEYIKKTIKAANEQIILVAHSARREQVEILAKLIKEQIKPKEVIICNVYPMNGVNAGPGLCAAYYFGTEITDLAYEKEIINEIVSRL
jgi:DegV family protein with EDD domain